MVIILSVVTINKDNFKNEVLDSSKTVLADFWASWCNPCKLVSPVVDEIAEERNDIKVCKINIDDEPDIALQYGVMSIPTFIVFKDGEIKTIKTGAYPKSEIIRMCEEHN